MPGLEQLDAAKGGGGIAPGEHAALLVSQGRALRQAGDPDAAMALFEQARKLETERGAAGSAAACLGEIANILQAHGEVDAALRIRREEQLPVFERLGDVRERAVTLGRIADILQDRGDLQGARVIQPYRRTCQDSVAGVCHAARVRSAKSRP